MKVFITVVMTKQDFPENNKEIAERQTEAIGHLLECNNKIVKLDIDIQTRITNMPPRLQELSDL